jgi:hypothetical protein
MRPEELSLVKIWLLAECIDEVCLMYGFDEPKEARQAAEDLRREHDVKLPDLPEGEPRWFVQALVLVRGFARYFTETWERGGLATLPWEAELIAELLRAEGVKLSKRNLNPLIG